MLGSNLSVIEDHKLEKLFNSNFEKYSHESIYYSDWDDIVSIEAKTRFLVKGKLKEAKVSTIETKDVLSRGIFYGGHKRKDFVFPAITQGAVGSLVYSEKLHDPHLISPFYFGDNIGVDQSVYSVVAPVNVVIDHKIFGTSPSDIKFTQEKIDDDKVKYTWRADNVKPFFKEDNSPGYSYIEPHIIVFIKSYTVRGVEKKILSGVDDYYAWCNQMLSLMSLSSKDVIQKQAEIITQGKTKDEEKVEAIFQWVQSNISYIAFEDGLSGFVPRPASDVYNKRYGDCKDMANLLKEMITASGIKAHVAWIGTRSKPYTFAEVPAPPSCNHMICMVPLNGKTLFLDATDSYSAFGLPSSMIQGKEALISLDNASFDVQKVPVVPRQQNQRIDSIKVELTTSGIRGKLTCSLRGYKKEDLEIAKLRDQLDKKIDFLEDFLVIGNNNIVFEEPVIRGLGEQNAQAVVELKFSLPGYYKNVGDRIYLNLNLTKKTSIEQVAPERNQWIELPYHYEDKLVVEFTLPSQYDVSYLPTNANETWNHFGLSTKYSTTGRKILFEKQFYAEALYIKPDEFAQWNDMVNKCSEISQQSIILTKTK
ncbi:MAG TPA: transglutaminase domain-containing protein [Cyclobacteriaceae bacterium]